MKIEIPESVMVTIHGLISRGIQAVEVSDAGHLIFTLTDGEKIDLGDIRGPEGPRGEAGPQGLKGDAGPQGPQGVQGPKGAPGQKGDTGAKGETGARGQPGPKGDSFQTVVEDDGNGNITIRALTTEETGTSGQNGYTFTPSVSPDGIISWTNDGGLVNPEPVNIKGPAGPAGADGKAGVDGKTPIKGTDYFTPEDKAGLVQDVLVALPNGDTEAY